MKLAVFILATILVSNIGPSCVTSSHEFAAEVVVQNYSLHSLNGWQRTEQGYASAAKSNPQLIVLLSETTAPNGLSITLQTPTEIVQNSQPLLKLISSSAKGTIRADVGHNVNGWSINCNDQTCQVNKNGIMIQTELIDNDLETSLEIKQTLSSCNENCRGVCVTAAQNPVCIDLQTKQEIDTIVKYLNISNNLNELLDSYRVTSESINVQDISPVSLNEIDWKSAMQQELVELKSKNIISLSDSDIEKISSLAKKGQAGVKYRIVYDSGVWTYYYKVSGAVLTSEKECISYKFNVETSPESSQALNTFYLVPVILISTGIILFLVLIVVSRTLLANKKPKKFKNI